MDPTSKEPTRVRLWREPVVHFFVLGALLFLFRGALASDERTIVVTPELKAHLARRFEDEFGKPPNPDELQKRIEQWERDEALYREALRQGLDEGDESVRDALVTKMRMLAEERLPSLEPTDEQLRAWLLKERNRYETPLRYDFEFLSFQRSEKESLDRVEKKASEGVLGADLGRPVMGGRLTASELSARLPPRLASSIPTLSLGEWHRLEGADAWYLVRVKGVSGGLPRLEDERARVLADYTRTTREKAVEELLSETVRRYRVEVSP